MRPQHFFGSGLMLAETLDQIHIWSKNIRKILICLWMIVRKCIRSALVTAQKTAKNAWKRHAHMPNWLDLSSVDNQGKFVIFWGIIGYELIITWFSVESVVLVAHDLLGDLPGGGQLLRIVFHRFQHPTGLSLHFFISICLTHLLWNSLDR